MSDKKIVDKKNTYSRENEVPQKESNFPQTKYPAKIQTFIPDESNYPKPEPRRHTFEELSEKYVKNKNVGTERKK